jgi:phosphoribosylformylglycinamidine synthase subunit PurSL
MTAIDTPTSAEPNTPVVARVEVHPHQDQPDPFADQYLSQVRQQFGQSAKLRTARVFLIESKLSPAAIEQIACELLADAVTQDPYIGVRASASASASLLTSESSEGAPPAATIEVHYLPGVMDPVAQSTRDAIIEMNPTLTREDIQVRTGWRFDISHIDDAACDTSSETLTDFAQGILANTVIQQIHTAPYQPTSFLHGTSYEMTLSHVSIRDLDDEGLKRLSREGHLFLSLDEMQSIQQYYRDADREPTDIELETLAQTWSEHCVHKTLKATIRYNDSNSSAPIDFADRPGHVLNEDGSVTINNLLKSTIAAATFKLMETQPHNEWCISVFEDNAGIVKFDDEDGVCIKVETHNHPSALEPYGGAATGIGGCIRDIMGTGLAAKPVANTDVFCVAPPDTTNLPKGVIPPKRVLKQISGGVRDYGNRMGIPTINGAVWFHKDYLGNPLVYCGCIGMLPLDKCFGDAQPGDRIIAMGGRTGRDGIHGATFSSAELTDTHADEFSHAVQIGNAITEKQTLDVILKARDYDGGPLYTAITDCGAGGFSSAIGEMGEKVGANVDLDKAPLKYDGLSYTEIWISEAQERMVMAVPQENIDKLAALCDAENVEMCDLGQFGWNADGPEGNDPQLVLNYQGTQVGKLSMALLHDGVPMPTRDAVWGEHASQAISDTAVTTNANDSSIGESLHALLAHPNIASKHWIIRQYDHEVQGGSVVKPLVGPAQDGPSDASVIRPKLGSDRGVALGCGMAPNLGEKSTEDGNTTNGDSYQATLAAIDEAVRNVVCTGADPSRIAILDNFCWPGCDDPKQLGSLVRASEACYDGAMAYKTPFVSGKDSLNNQFTTEAGDLITIPQTLLITAISIVKDANKCITMDAKAAGNLLILVGNTTDALGGSHLILAGQSGSEIRNRAIPTMDLSVGPRTAATIASLIEDSCIASAHDCSDGGLLVAAAEMAFAGRIGVDIDLAGVASEQPLTTTEACFAETSCRYLLEVTPDQIDTVIRKLQAANLPFGQVGTFNDSEKLTVRTADQGQVASESLDKLCETWLAPLDW